MKRRCVVSSRIVAMMAFIFLCLVAAVATPPTSAQAAIGSFVKITGGEFMMGRSGDLAGTDDHRPHRVKVDNYRLAATEVTNQEFADIYNWAIQQNLIEIEGTNSSTVKLFDRSSNRLLHTTSSSSANSGELPRLLFVGGGW